MNVIFGLARYVGLAPARCRGSRHRHELSQQAGGVQAAVSFERGHKLYKVDADIDLADNIDPAELQKIFATLVPKAAGRTKASARKKR